MLLFIKLFQVVETTENRQAKRRESCELLRLRLSFLLSIASPLCRIEFQTEIYI